MEDDEYLLKAVKDQRLKRLIWEVWSRLPEYDRQVVRNLPVNVLQDDEIESTKGTTEWVDGDGDAYEIRLYPRIDSDGACRYVIAHEFAHIILRHVVLRKFVTGFESGISTYTGLEQVALEFWNEEHAIIQVYLWGFEEEIKSYFDNYPDEDCPRFFKVWFWKDGQS